MILAQRAALIAARAKADNAEAEPRRRALLIDQMKLTIARLRHERFRQSSERSAALDGTSGTPRGRPWPFGEASRVRPLSKAGRGTLFTARFHPTRLRATRGATLPSGPFSGGMGASR
jgi:hypothetical protein